LNLRSFVRYVVPSPLRSFLKQSRQYLKRKHRHIKWHLARMRGQVVTRDFLIANLKRIGIQQGDIVLVHSSLSSFGHVEGGPDAIIDALFRTVGPQGTILMPSYPIVGDWMVYVHSDPLFNPRESPSSMGRITDVFWRRPDVLRSLHPTHSVAAYGHHAKYLLKDHEKSQTPCGWPSPFRKLVELDGRILHLGSPFGNTTSVHVVEDVLPNFPKKVYEDIITPMRYLDYQGVEHTALVKIHNENIVRTRIDRHKGKETEIYEYCQLHSVVHTGIIGLATVHLIEAKALEILLEKLAKEGITIYA
jgi:aminoglycoside 3-N-acetyltransferase